MKQFLLSIVFLVNLLRLGAQNLVVNPGLETIDKNIKVTNPEDSFQVYHIPGWFNPGFSTTDYFNSDGNHSTTGAKYYRGEMKAHSGVGFAGFYTDNTKWKEYVGINFTDTLVAGKNYHLELYLATSVNCQYALSSLQVEFWDVNYVKIIYTNAKYPMVNDRFPPVFIMGTGKTNLVDNWVKFSVDFTAVGGETSMIIGYFNDLFQTNPLPVTPQNKRKKPGAYNYIDDVSLVQTNDPPIIRKVVSRPTIYFDVNKATIKPEFFAPLDDVVERMKKNALLKIEVDGFTDVDATDSFNIKLSQRRAQAVADYIISKGIDPKRITVKWFAEELQVSDDKALNRRVEFKYFEK